MAEIEKSQAIRALDFLVLGPFMILVSRDLQGWKKSVLLVAGVLTITYNLNNYLQNEKIRRL